MAKTKSLNIMQEAFDFLCASEGVFASLRDREALDREVANGFIKRSRAMRRRLSGPPQKPSLGSAILANLSGSKDMKNPIHDLPDNQARRLLARIYDALYLEDDGTYNEEKEQKSCADFVVACEATSRA